MTSERKETEKKGEGGRENSQVAFDEANLSVLPSIFSLTAKPTNNLLDSPPHP